MADNPVMSVLRAVCPDLKEIPLDLTFETNGIGTYELHRIVTTLLVEGNLEFRDWPYFFDTRYDTVSDLMEAISCE